ncbi:hypothetical protein ACFWAX_30100, partial [Streptomyces sp. NPDC059956]
MAYPLHATALTIHAATGADISRLALIRGIDISAKEIHAAGIHGQLNDRAPDSPLFPLITVQDGEQLRLT